MAKISVLGMGAMGSRMAQRLLQAGHTVTVWNRSADRTTSLRDAGAAVASTPREAASGAHCVMAVVRDDVASREVWLHPELGALAGLSGDAIACERSTLSLSWVRELAAACVARGVGFLDAPVLGSRPQAEAGALISFVGADEGLFERARPLLEVMGSAVHHVGPVGAGAALKLATNALFAAQVASLAELLELLRAQGLDLARALEVLATTPVVSPAAKAAAGSMFASAFAPAFPVELVEKDLGYVIASAPAAGAPISAATRAVFARARLAGLGAHNLTAVISLYR